MSNKLCKCGKVSEISCPSDERCGTANTQLPADFKRELDDLVMRHTLELRNDNDYQIGFEKGIEDGIEIGATEWARWKVRFDEQEEQLRQAQLSVKSLRYSLDQRDQQLKELKERAERYENTLKAILNRPAPLCHKTHIAWVNAARKECEDALKGESTKGGLPAIHPILNDDDIKAWEGKEVEK